LILRKKSENSLGTGLTVDSVIRLHKIVTIPKNIIKRKLGTINESIAIEVSEKIRQLFDNE